MVVQDNTLNTSYANSPDVPFQIPWQNVPSNPLVTWESLPGGSTILTFLREFDGFITLENLYNGSFSIVGEDNPTVTGGTMSVLYNFANLSTVFLSAYLSMKKGGKIGFPASNNTSVKVLTNLALSLAGKTIQK